MSSSSLRVSICLMRSFFKLKPTVFHKSTPPLSIWHLRGSYRSSHVNPPKPANCVRLHMPPAPPWGSHGICRALFGVGSFDDPIAQAWSRSPTCRNLRTLATVAPVMIALSLRIMYRKNTVFLRNDVVGRSCAVRTMSQTPYRHGRLRRWCEARSRFCGPAPPTNF